MIVVYLLWIIIKTESRNPFMLQNPELHYLDNAATTIVAPEVADVIDKAMREFPVNPVCSN